MKRAGTELGQHCKMNGINTHVRCWPYFLEQHLQSAASQNKPCCTARRLHFREIRKATRQFSNYSQGSSQLLPGTTITVGTAM
jgi:hypothetical protein